MSLEYAQTMFQRRLADLEAREVEAWAVLNQVLGAKEECRQVIAFLGSIEEAEARAIEEGLEPCEATLNELITQALAEADCETRKEPVDVADVDHDTESGGT